MSAVGLRPLFSALGLLLLAGIASFLVKLYQKRKKFIFLRRQGMPMPPYHPVFGHLLLMRELGSMMPVGAHGHYYGSVIRRAYPDLPPNFYLDLWPFGDQMLLVTDPKAANQFTQALSLPKAPGLQAYIKPLTGEKALLTMEGKEWKIWRGIYNSGFAASHLLTLVPGIVEDTQKFCKVLKEHAKAGGLFKLEEICTRLTVDIIGRVVLDTRMNAQTSENDLLAGYLSQVRWLPIGDEVLPWKVYRPLRPFVYWYNTRRMNRWLSRELDQRFASRKDVVQAGMLKRGKPVIDLALDTYLAEQDLNPNHATEMDKTFKDFAMSQIKLFIFAGHDTTSSTLCYIFYLLSYNHEAYDKLCSELNSVFGTNLTRTASLIRDDPHLLNKVPYMLGVIKEALRLFPPASTVRWGLPGFFIDANGQQLPTDGLVTWSVHQAMHRDSALWPEPEAFIPERWLVPEGDPLYPVKSAFRPFEFGPRNCIGQELAMLETRVIIALTIREFRIKPAYAEYDKMRGVVPKTLAGERAYQILLGSGKPVDGMPVRVSLR